MTLPTRQDDTRDRLFVDGSTRRRRTMRDDSPSFSSSTVVLASESTAEREIKMRRRRISRRLPPHFTIGERVLSTTLTTSSMSPSSEIDDASLLERASKLRKEASDLETELRAQKQQQPEKKQPLQQEQEASYTTMKDSTWIIKYRFSDQPESRKQEDDNSGNENKSPSSRLPWSSSKQQQQAQEGGDSASSSSSSSKRTFYTGTMTLLFKSDGYTDVVMSSSSMDEDYESSSQITINKVWGWDVETSSENDDDQDYLLFSMDAMVPTDTGRAYDDDNDDDDDGNQQQKVKKRFYFQARQEVLDATDGIITLQEGTITIKQDVFDSGSRWGLFSPRGILAEFRYVGDFIAKPIKYQQ